jgi:hypothetical protein
VSNTAALVPKACCYGPRKGITGTSLALLLPNHIRLTGKPAARAARHSSTVFEPFERLHGRQAVATLTKMLEPPRLSGTI